ncbi:MAG: hypothetical protein WED10_11900 [Brumimicrobium sp.]
MKKLVIILMTMSLSAVGFSQTYEMAVGLKGNGLPGPVGRHYSGGGINFKHFIGGRNALEYTVGGGHEHLRAQVLYEWQHSTGITEGLDWYLGAGGTIGAWGNGYYHPSNDDDYYDRGLYLGANGVIGLDWNIEPLTGVPIGFAVDSGPYIGIINSHAFGWGGAFAVRYIIK